MSLVPLSMFQSTACQVVYELAKLVAVRIGPAPDDRCEWPDEAQHLLQCAILPLTWAAFVQEFASPDDGDALHETLRKARAAAVIAACTFTARAQNERNRRFALRMKQIPGSDIVVAALQDCTELEQREAEMLRVGESQDRLQQLGRWSLLGEMASGLAHEINQPLAAISTFAQAGERMMGLNPPKIERAASLFAEISGQALRAGDVVQRMRGLVKRQGSDARVMTSAEILGDFRALAAPIARTQQVELEIVDPASDLKVLIDPIHVQQVLVSLFRNAIDAMREQPPTNRRIRVEASGTTDQVSLQVTDSGPGIPDDVARELFRPFFTTKADGTGLGLSVCRSIVAEHGGTLQFENVNPGARFTVRLPRVMARES